ncbi:hypothetical protein GUJ93_ZPchr0012g19851 [Zizania palustris]|uniref:BHLH domain-containing protein n=1 Tax=Zizania palustris TaxID=103762 RepID=A0A8J5WMV4_ZIZPA|nr:hypothetical protein GUJ93_ZPchr0012g19851 [Zizania palustris]
MALEAVVYPHGGYFGGYGMMGPASYAAAQWCCDDVTAAASVEPCVGGGDGSWDPLIASVVQQDVDEYSSSCKASAPEREAPPVKAAAGKRKRRRAKALKNKEDIENQRMSHIAVERNRRRQMNEYLAVLRSLMPSSYVQRGDQASIVGGAINYVRELEQLLQTLEVHKGLKEHNAGAGHSSPSPFASFFTFPQYSTSGHVGGSDDHRTKPAAETIADIEASMAEGYASVKVQTRRRPRQLLKLVAGLQQLGLTTLHLNVTTVANMVMYSLSLKVENGCKIGSVEEIATAVHEILGRIQE